MINESANPPDLETIARIEPTLLDEVPGELNDVVAELAAASSRLGSSLHATTAASLADLVRIMNTYYSNLIEGHNTRPRDIVRALAGNFARDADCTASSIAMRPRRCYASTPTTSRSS